MSQRQFSQEIRLDPNVFLAFYDYVQKQHCHEALHFFLASEEYAGLPHPHRAKAEAALFAEYLVERAPEKINIADPIMKRVRFSPSRLSRTRNLLPLLIIGFFALDCILPAEEGAIAHLWAP